MTAPLPISRATNAFDLLEELKAVIREEPERLYMGDWFSRFRGEGKWMTHLRPACGTIACAAGWMTVLGGGDNTKDAEWFALAMVPPSSRKSLQRLFYSDPSNARGFLRAGSMEAAEWIADQICLIQRFYEHDLKAFALVPPVEMA